MATPPRRRRFSATEPFTRAEARAAGLSLAALRGPRFHKVFYNLYVCSSVDVTAAVVRAAAALRVCNEGSYVSHFTAAEVWGACVPDQPLTHVSVRQGNRSERRGIQAHVAPRAANTTTYQGLLVATAEQTFLDLSGLMSLVELVVLGDSLVRKERTTPEELIRAAAAFRGRGARWRGEPPTLLGAGWTHPWNPD